MQADYRHVATIRGRTTVTEPQQRVALIVDDNHYNRDLSALSLRHVGFQVVEAENGARALEILQGQSFDLMVLDLAMPEVDGVTVLRQLREIPTANAMCVVIMTANPHMLTDEVNDQADFIMHKPIDVMEFARFARRLTEATV
jgi:CheY-like chemotaxis protein